MVGGFAGEGMPRDRSGRTDLGIRKLASVSRKKSPRASYELSINRLFALAGSRRVMPGWGAWAQIGFRERGGGTFLPTTVCQTVADEHGRCTTTPAGASCCCLHGRGTKFGALCLPVEASGAASSYERGVVNGPVTPHGPQHAGQTAS